MNPQIPNVAAALSRVLASIPREQQPLLIAFAERLAATRYRSWAAEVADTRNAAELRACADREEDIARRIEGLFPNAAAAQSELVANHPELDEINRSLFAGRSLAEQFAIQAGGERLGARTWTAFADHSPSSSARATFLVCAQLEEASALVLEALLASGAV